MTIVTQAGWRRRPPYAASRVRWDVLVLGAVLGIPVVVGGSFYIGELVAVLYLLIAGTRRRFGRFEIRLILGAVLWAFAQFVSDLINNTPPMTSVKGVLAPLLFAATVLYVGRNVCRHHEWLPSFLLGTILASLGVLVVAPGPYVALNPWKWGYGSALIGTLVVVYSFYRPRLLVAVFPIALAAFFVYSVLNSARSMAMWPALGYFSYLAWNSRYSPWLKNFFGGRFGFLRVILMGAMLLVIAEMAFHSLFTSRLLLDHVSEADRLKYQTQASSDLGILLGGRSESLISIKAFLDSPLYGHGSWATDKTGEYISLYEWSLYRAGVSERDNYEFSDQSLIPAHSYLFGAMVWAGVMGGVFWLGVMYWLFAVYREFAQRLPLYFHVGIFSILWAIMFSPFGYSARWAAAVFFGALVGWVSLIGRGRA